MQARRVYEYLVASLDRSPALALLGRYQKEEQITVTSVFDLA